MRTIFISILAYVTFSKRQIHVSIHLIASAYNERTNVSTKADNV